MKHLGNELKKGGVYVSTQKQTVKPDYNALTGLIVVTIGAIYLLMTALTQRSSMGDPMAPLYFPLGLGSVLVILGVAQILRSDIQKSIESVKNIRNMGAKDKKITKMIAFTSLSGVVYALVFEHVGFVIATTVFMLSMLWLTNPKEWFRNSMIAIGFSICIYVLFTRALGIPLPQMPYVGL